VSECVEHARVAAASIRALNLTTMFSGVVGGYLWPSDVDAVVGVVSTATLGHRKRSGRSTIVLVGLGLGLAAVAAFVWLAPAWLTILAVLGLVVVGSVLATRPADVSLARHIAALIGEAVLDVLRTVLRAVVGVIVVLALIAALWSFAAPRIEAQVGAWRDSAVGSAKTAVQGAVSVPHVPSIHLPWTGADK
jgi:hypothetical protein